MREQLGIEKIEQIKQAKKGDKVAFEAIIMDNIDYLYRVAYTTLRNEDNVDDAIQQSSNAYANRYTNPNIEHLPLTREYKVYDSNGKELSCFPTCNKNTLIYSNGVREDYDPHDIPNKKYSNATWETIEYLLIENTDTDYIKIVPVETVRNPVDGVEDHGGETYYEMDPLVINL